MLLSVAAAIACGGAPAAANAANNPGTGDTGFFTFRPSTAVGGTQINVASGNALVRARDLSDNDVNYHVVVDRSYNSLASDAFSILGPRWAFDVGPATKLEAQGNGDASVTGPSGYRLLFARQANGTYQAPEGFDGSLVATSSGWTLTRASQGDQFGFNGSGQLSWTKDAQARDFTVQGTSAAGRDVLSSYGTSSGRRVNFSYTGDSLVREMDDPSSGHHYYTYTAGKLTGYRSPSGAQATYRYGSNGFLDRITDSDGTTVELTTTAGGRVQSITSTPAGASAGETTSFVYTRRPYKTDVTGPDSVRRTYAYDDDWRVTRQYNPDAKPTVSVSGPLYDRRDDYTNGREGLGASVSATEPDGAGIDHLAVEEVGGAELGHADPVCTTTPFDRICPADVSESFDVDLTSLPDGTHQLRAIARDDEGNVSGSDPWTIVIDRTPPAFAADFLITANIDPDTHTAIVDWDAAADHTLGDGSDPSGPGGGYRYRYQRPGETFSAWQTTDLERAEIPNSAEGDQFVFEIVPLDQAGNSGDTKVASVTVSGEGDHCQPTANGAPSDCFDDVPFSDDAEENEPEEGAELEEIPTTDLARPGLAPMTAARRTRIRVEGDGNWATIRRAPQSYVVGNAYGKPGSGWQMDVVRQDYSDKLGWVTGKVYGGYQSCGWVSVKRAPSTDHFVDTSCPRNFYAKPEEFADGLNCQASGTIKECGRGTTIQLRKTVTDVDECLNVGSPPIGHYPTRCENKVASRLTPEKIRDGYTVQWRYTTNGRTLPGGSRFVMVVDKHIKNNRAGRWVFIPRRAFRSHLCTRTATHKYACGAPQ